MRGLTAGMDEAEARHGITSKLILCFLRHLDEDRRVRDACSRRSPG